MDSCFKVLAGIFCAALFAIGIWLATNVLMAPSKSADKNIALMCDFARPQDIEALETLSKKIHSAWWRNYAESRLRGKIGGTADDVVSEIFRTFYDNGIRAYLLAGQAEYNSELLNKFYLLPESEAELASIIYAIRKGMRMDAGVLGNFKEICTRQRDARTRRHYGDILMTEAFKKRDAYTANEILKTLELNSFSWAWIFVLNGADPDLLTAAPAVEKESLRAIYAYMRPDENLQKPSLEYMQKAVKKLGPYNYGGIRNWADAMWEAGAKDDALMVLRRMYAVPGKSGRVFEIRNTTLNIIVQCLGAKGRFDYASEYFYANAGNSELLFGLVSEASLSAARMGRMEDAINQMRRISSLEGRFETTFRLPSHPEDWAN